MPQKHFFAIMALLSIIVYYIIQVLNKKNSETTLVVFFIYTYFFILLIPGYTSLINKIILIVLLLIYIIEEVFSLIKYKKRYLIFILSFYLFLLIYSLSILYFKEMLPILNVFDNGSLSSSYKNVILSLLLYLFLPFVLRYILLKRLDLKRNIV